jgi:hypothetical protein
LVCAYVKVNMGGLLGSFTRCHVQHAQTKWTPYIATHTPHTHTHTHTHVNKICREAESAMNYYQLSDTVRNTVMKVVGHMTAPESVASSCE